MLLNPKNYINSLKMLLVMPTAALIRKKRPNVWLVSERFDQARDNGYCFFKYLREKHPETEAYYIIKKDAPDRKKIEQYGNIIDYNSIRHYFYFRLARIHISAHDFMCAPSAGFIMRLIKKRKTHKNVYLQHGVCDKVLDFLSAKYNKFDLFIWAERLEYENLTVYHGYKKEQLAYTGLPRFDGLHDIKVNPKQILVMPSWRNYLAQNSETVIEETKYFRAYQSLLANRELADALDSADCHMIFYLHNNMRPYANSFKTNCPNITVVYDDKTYDIQELLKSSALMITDYSSVHFDFAYMGKPVIYYQFDKEDYFSKQYGKGPYDIEKHGYGPVVYDEIELVSEIKNSIDRDFVMDDFYYNRMTASFQLRDRCNCERVYNAIMEKERTVWSR